MEIILKGNYSYGAHPTFYNYIVIFFLDTFLNNYLSKLFKWSLLWLNPTLCCLLTLKAAVFQKHVFSKGYLSINQICKQRNTILSLYSAKLVPVALSCHCQQTRLSIKLSISQIIHSHGYTEVLVQQCFVRSAKYQIVFYSMTTDETFRHNITVI